MRRDGGTRVVGALVAAVAVLLPAGVWSATAVDNAPVSHPAPGPVGLAGLSQSALEDEPAPSGPTTTVAPTSTTTSTVRATSSTTATTKPSSATTTTAPAKAGSSTTSTVPALPAGHVPAASSWKADVPGLSVRLRMEPERPMAGQIVRFHLDVTSLDRCCHAFMNFNDGSGWLLHDQVMCTFEGELTPGAHPAVVNHTYAKPGAYILDFRVHDGSMCEPFPATGPPFRHIELQACVVVGPDPETTSCPIPDPWAFLPPAMRSVGG